MKSSSTGFIGAGNMAQALIAGMRRLGIKPSQIGAHDPDRVKLKKVAAQFKIQSFSDNREVVRKCGLIVLATKPQEMKAVLREIAPEITNQGIVSIAAGLDTATLAKNLKLKTSTQGGSKSRGQNSKLKLVRAMPNNPALIGEGITALYSPSPLSPKEKRRVENLFRGAGEVLWVHREKDLDAVTGLSGSGPAYLYRFVEALSQAGVKMGLKPPIAHRLALKTVLGSALTLQRTGKSPSELIPLVTSKKGTTLSGLKILDKRRFNLIIHQTVRAATQRARQILKELKEN